MEWLIMFGVPAAITGLAVWWLKKKIDENEKRHQEKESSLEDLMLLMMNATKSNSVGITAIARAVQRIPDAKCNGDMTAALEEMEKIEKEEANFIAKKGIKYIFND